MTGYDYKKLRNQVSMAEKENVSSAYQYFFRPRKKKKYENKGTKEGSLLNQEIGQLKNHLITVQLISVDFTC